MDQIGYRTVSIWEVYGRGRLDYPSQYYYTYYTDKVSVK